MQTLTDGELTRQPQQLIDDARGGKVVIVTTAGEPVLIALPLGKGVASRATLVELAAALFDCEQISLGLAARIAGLSYSEMIDELGRRQIPVVRCGVEDVDRELEYVHSLGRSP